MTPPSPTIDQSIKLKRGYVDSYLNRGLVHEDKKDYDSASRRLQPRHRA